MVKNSFNKLLWSAGSSDSTHLPNLDDVSVGLVRAKANAKMLGRFVARKQESDLCCHQFRVDRQAGDKFSSILDPSSIPRQLQVGSCVNATHRDQRGSALCGACMRCAICPPPSSSSWGMRNWSLWFRSWRVCSDSYTNHRGLQKLANQNTCSKSKSRLLCARTAQKGTKATHHTARWRPSGGSRRPAYSRIFETSPIPFIKKLEDAKDKAAFLTHQNAALSFASSSFFHGYPMLPILLDSQCTSDTRRLPFHSSCLSN